MILHDWIKEHLWWFDSIHTVGIGRIVPLKKKNQPQLHFLYTTYRNCCCIPISYPSPFYLIPTHDDFRLVNSVRLGIFVIKSKSPRNLCHSVGTQSDWYDQASRKSWARLEYEELSRLRVWEDLRLGKILWSLIALDLFFGFPYLWNYAMAPLQMDQSKIRYKSKINSCDHDHSIFYH